jgi:hypothetical protein
MEELQTDALGRLNAPTEYRQDWDAYAQLADEATPAEENDENDE